MDHQLLDERSLWLAKHIAQRLREKPELWEKPCAFVKRFSHDQCHGARIWRKIMQKPPEVILAMYLRDDEKGRQIRQSAPFAGVLGFDERDRLCAEFWRIKGLPPVEIDPVDFEKLR